MLYLFAGRLPSVNLLDEHLSFGLGNRRGVEQAQPEGQQRVGKNDRERAARWLTAKGYFI